MIKLVSRYLTGKARLFAFLAPLMMLLEVIMDLQQPAVMARIIDIGVARGDLSYVIACGLHMSWMAAAGFLGGAACSVFASYAAVDMGGRMRLGLFGKIQSLSFAEIDRFRTSSLITRLTNDVMQMQNMLTMMLRVMVRSPITFLGSIVMAFLLSPRLALLFAFVLPVVIVGIVTIIGKSVPAFALVQGCLDRVNTIMRENLLGIRVVKAFTLEGPQADRFDLANANLTAASVRSQNITFLLMPLVNLVMNLSVVAVLWFGGKMVLGKSLEIGKIMAFINYLVQITHSLVMAVNLVVNISRAGASSGRISEVLDVRPGIVEPRTPRTPVRWDIEFRDVYFAYIKGGKPVLQDLSFRVESGTTLGIIGATGSGKSTLASLIPRLYDPGSGKILIGGIDIRDLSLEELRRRIGFVMQESVLLSGDIEGNLRFGNGAATVADIERASRDAQAFDFITALPFSFENRVEQRGRNFSGGQRQRISIARTLLRDPEILILDDSTSSIDLGTESRLKSALAARMKGKTVIMIAQRISAVMGMDRIIVLDFGRMVDLGTHAELLGRCDLYRSIAVSQLGSEALAHA